MGAQPYLGLPIVCHDLLMLRRRPDVVGAPSFIESAGDVPYQATTPQARRRSAIITVATMESTSEPKHPILFE